MGIKSQFQLRTSNKLESVSKHPSFSIPLINAKASDADMKKAELNCKGGAACCLSTAGSLINSSNDKTVVMLI